MTEVAMGGPTMPSAERSKRHFPSFVQNPGVELPPERPVPPNDEALAALKRCRQHHTEEDSDLVQRWIAAAKGDPTEYARRIKLTA